MGIARGWEKRVIRTNITYAKRTVRIFSFSPQSRSLFSASFQTFCLTARAYLSTPKYGLFCSIEVTEKWQKILVSFQIQREVLESHLEGEIRYHLHLSCCKLNDTKDEVRNLQLEVGERAQAVHNQFEERVQVLQNHFEDRLHALQNRFEERVQALENHFEERVNLITVTSDKWRKNFTRIICAVAVVILAALSGMSNYESAISGLKTEMEGRVDEVHKHLKAKVSRSMYETSWETYK